MYKVTSLARNTLEFVAFSKGKKTFFSLQPSSTVLVDSLSSRLKEFEKKGMVSFKEVKETPNTFKVDTATTLKVNTKPSKKFGVSVSNKETPVKDVSVKAENK